MNSLDAGLRLNEKVCRKMLYIQPDTWNLIKIISLVNLICMLWCFPKLDKLQSECSDWNIMQTSRKCVQVVLCCIHLQPETHERAPQREYWLFFSISLCYPHNKLKRDIMSLIILHVQAEMKQDRRLCLSYNMKVWLWSKDPSVVIVYLQDWCVATLALGQYINWHSTIALLLFLFFPQK